MSGFEYNSIIDDGFAILNPIEPYLVSNVKQGIIHSFDFGKIYCISSGLFLQGSREGHPASFRNDSEEPRLDHLMLTLSTLTGISKHLFFS